MCVLSLLITGWLLVDGSALAAHDPVLPAATLERGNLHLAGVGTSITHPHPLEALSELLAAGRLSQAQQALDGLLVGLDGRLLLPRAGLESTGPWARAPSAAVQLAEWARTESLRTTRFEARVSSDAPNLPPSLHPVLWHPAQRDEAQAIFWRHVEAGRLSEAHRLQMTRTDLQVPSAVTAWLRGALIADLPRPDIPHPDLPSTWHVVARFALGPAAPLRVPEELDVPAPNPGPALVSALRTGGGRALLSLGDGLWQLDGTPADGTPEDRASHPPEASQAPRLHRILEPSDPPRTGPRHQVLAPVAVADWILVPARGMRPEAPYEFTGVDQRGGGWVDWRLWRRGIDGMLQPRRTGAQRFLDTCQQRGSIIAPPCIDQQLDQIAVLVVEGFEVLRVSLHAASLSRGEPRWSRPIGEFACPWHSARDLRTLLPTGALVRAGTRYLAAPGLGWIAEVEVFDGALGGLIFYDTVDPSEQPSESLFSLGATRFRTLPAPRPEPYPSPRGVRGAEGRPLLVLRPADSTHLLAVDLERGRLAWAHGPLPAGATLVPEAGELLVFEEQGNEWQLRWLEPETGRVACELSYPGSPPAWGPPLRTASGLAIPTERGVFIGTLPGSVHGASGTRAAGTAIPEGCAPIPLSCLPWPARVTGGTLAGLSHERWLVLERGNPALDLPVAAVVLAPGRE